MSLRITFALAILSSFFHSTSNASAFAANKISLTVPAAPWSMTFSDAELQLLKQQIKPDGKYGYFMLSDSKTDLIVSVFIEPALKCKDSKSCRDMIWKAGNPSWQNPQNIRQAEIDGVSILEFLIPSFNGRPVQQHNLYAEYVVDGFWVDLHVSKVLYKPEDHPLFERLLKGIKFEYTKEAKNDAKQMIDNAKGNSAEETMMLMGQGSKAYLMRDYKNAIKYYSKALELEKKTPTLPRNLWRVLVDNLGMSYGISGDNAKAKEIFEYGLSKDATYPMFYYNLACAYAEMGDLENSIKNLQLAYKFRDNMIPGEVLPDPAHDSSFSRYLQDEKFRKALKELQAK